MKTIIEDYFPEYNPEIIRRLHSLESFYREWNSRINVISRKDIDNFLVHHLLHSLCIAKLVTFLPGTRILDAGTGGGFPGIPLAVLFPEVSFTLVDSIGKKVKVVKEVAESAGINNVIPVVSRIENLELEYDFVVSRAVTAFQPFVRMSSKLVAAKSFNKIENGIIYLKGGDISSELGDYINRVSIYQISDFFDESYFKEKKIVHLAYSDIHIF